MSSNPRIKLLLVDDSLVMRKTIISMINKFDLDREVQIHEAENGIEAMEWVQLTHLEDRNYDLILCDWMMPKKSGKEFIQDLKDVQEFKHIPIIMLTAETYDSQISKMVELGVHAYITKPFTAQTLEEIFKTILKL